MFAAISERSTSPNQVRSLLTGARDKDIDITRAVAFAADERWIPDGSIREALDVLKLTGESERKSQLMALALSLDGKVHQARAILKKLRHTAEAGGIAGGICKRKWIETGRDVWLKLAYQEFRQAYDENRSYPDAHYPGINAAALALHHLGRPDESRAVAREVADSVLATVPAKREPWEIGSLAEALLLLGYCDDAACKHTSNNGRLCDFGHQTRPALAV